MLGYALRVTCLFIGAVAVTAQPEDARMNDSKSAPDAQQPPAAIHKAVLVAAPRAAVYKAWTSAEALTQWFPTQAKVVLEFDGPYETYFIPDAPEGSRGGEGNKVLAYVENELLAFTWNAPPKFMPERGTRTFVVVRFEDAEDGKTRVRLTHDGFRAGGQWPQVREYFDAAWGAVLGMLEKRFAEGPLHAEADRKVIEPHPARYFVEYIYPTRPELMTEQPTAEELPHLQGHVQHIQQLLAEGRLVLAGPTLPGGQYPTGEASKPLETLPTGIVIFRANSEEEALEIMMRDPAVKHGVFKGVVYPFRLSFERY
jgi:uncharacterized protein YndB with AHSA1/START domain/uncharacterized protein YciI